MSIHNLISNWFSQTSHTDVVLDDQTQLHSHLQTYRLLGNLPFADYIEWSFVFSKFRLSSELSGLYICTVYLLSGRIKECLYTITPVSSIYPLLYVFSVRTSALLRPILVKWTSVPSTTLLSHSSNFATRFSPTNVVKYLTTWTAAVLDVLFLRKNKVFNKGRYSRNRQFYRTGVYWCLYINIIAMIGLYFWFYRFVMNFGYLWWLLYLSLTSFVLAKSFNYRIILPWDLIRSVRADLVFFSLLLHSCVAPIWRTLSTRVAKLAYLASRIFSNLPYLKNSSFIWPVIYYLKSLIPTYAQMLVLFKYTNVNYYIHSITLNYNRVFLASKKIDFFTAYVRMLIR